MNLLKKALLAFLTILLFLNSPAMGSQESEPKTVLILYSLSYAYPAVVGWDQSIRSVFGTQQDINIKVTTEHLDLSRYNDSSYIRMMVDIFRYKYLESKPDLIVVVFEPALDFVLKFKQELFPDVPIIFGGIERLSFDITDLDPNIKGVYQEGTTYARTLELALNLHPDTRHVVVIAGTGFMEQAWLRSARNMFQKHVDRLKFTYMTDLPLSEIQNNVAKLPANSVVMYLPVLEDATEKAYVAVDALSQISEASSVPIYSFYDVVVGHGTVGGYVRSFAVQGKTAAELGLRILKGIPSADIRVIQNKDLGYMFDWRQLRRWSIPEHRLPPGSIVRFKELTFWEKYKGRIIVTFVVVLFQTLIISYLLYQRRIRRKVDQNYRTVADYTYDWEYWQRSDGHFNYISPSCERITGYNAEEFIDDPNLLDQIIVPEDRDIWSNHRQKALKKSKPKEIQFRIQRPDGEIRWIEHACQPVFDDQGKNQGVRASNRDITKRIFYRSETQKLQSELAHMDRVVTISTLTSALAHEINQPLAAMRSYAQAALRFMNKDHPEYDSVHKALQGIVEDNKRAAEVVNRLRDLVKKGPTHKETIDINSIINDVIRLINSELVLRNASITLKLQPGAPVVQADPIQIQQVLLNLLTNALDAMDDQPIDRRTITISTKPENLNEIIVSISDSGRGIPPDIIKAIFSPFYTTKSTGMGLGLSICRSIIEAHAGNIFAENNPDGGATFSFTLPIDKK